MPWCVGTAADSPVVGWDRYAEFEWEHGDKEAGTWRQIYERSVAAVPHSVDIWVYYCGAAADRIEDAAEVER